MIINPKKGQKIKPCREQNQKIKKKIPCMSETSLQQVRVGVNKKNKLFRY